MKTRHINFLLWNSFLICLLAAFSMYGGQNYSAKNSVARILSHRVTFPEQLKSETRMSARPYTAVLWISGEECTRCRINTLPAYMEFYEAWKEYLDFFVLVSSVDALSYSQMVKDQCLPFPVYFDERNQFRSKNRYIPNKTEYHFLLLNSSKIPIIVGDPVVNDEIYRLYTEVLGVTLATR